MLYRANQEDPRGGQPPRHAVRIIREQRREGVPQVEPLNGLHGPKYTSKQDVPLAIVGHREDQRHWIRADSERIGKLHAQWRAANPRVNLEEGPLPIAYGYRESIADLMFDM